METRFFQADWELGVGLRTWSNAEPYASGAWSYGLPRLTNFTQTSTVPGPNGGASPDGSVTCGVTLNYTFVDVNGSSHQLYLAHVFDNTGPVNGFPNYQCTQANFPERDQFGGDSIFQARFTNLQPDSDHDMSNPAQPNDGQPVVAGPDGTLYTFPALLCGFTNSPSACSRLPSSIEDKNGNILTFPTSGQSVNNPTFSVIDTAGRTALAGSSFGLTGSTVTVSGLEHPYTLTWQTTSYPGYSVYAENNSLQGTLFCAPSGNIATGAWTQLEVSSIQLPNGQSYQFSYDPQYGTLKQITYPSGGYIKYDYDLNLLSTAVAFNGIGGPGNGNGNDLIIADACYDHIDTAAVSHRYVSFNGQGDDLVQDFKYSTDWAGVGWGKKTTTVTTHDLDRQTTYNTTYTYFGLQIQAPPGGSGVNAQAGVEQTIAYSDTDGAPLKTVTKGWNDQFTLACEVDTWGLSGPSSAVFNTYGSGDVVTDVKEYDYGLVSPSSCSNGASAPSGIMPTRETVTTIQPFGDTTYPSSPSLLNNPCRVVVSGNGIAAETDYFYDGGTSLCGTAGTPSVASVSSPLPLPSGTHDPLFSASGTVSRGNVTQILRVNAGSSPITTMTYDETGQVVSIKDPCGNTTCSDMTGTGHTTTYSYSTTPTCGNDTNHTNAYVTQITLPSVNGIAQQNCYTYNYSTGSVASGTDPNGQPTLYKYNTPPSGCHLLDGLNRLSETDFPDGGKTTYCYNDAGLSIKTTTIATPDPDIVHTTKFDGLGHVIRTELSDPEGIDCVDTVYDGDGRIYTVSNSHRSSPQPTDGSTVYTYDALGRLRFLTHEPDGSSQQWQYSGQNNGIVTTFTDETNNNSWQRTSDALGRLINVVEPGSLSTIYTYNALDDLTAVNQIGNSSAGDVALARSFTYDSLSHLLTSTNPETGTTCYGVWNGNCVNGYDANGNLQHKTDASGFTIDYSYDVLNRLVYKGDSGAGSAAFNYAYSYDTGDGTYGTYGIGRLTGYTNGATANSVFSYNPMGRVTRQANYTPSSPDDSSIVTRTTYDLAGKVTSLTYPDGRYVSQTWSSAGRLLSVNQTPPNDSNNIIQSYLQSGLYYSDGSPNTLKLGNNALQTVGKNPRLQVESIVLGPTEAPYLSHAYCYMNCLPGGGGVANNGNIWQIADVLNPGLTQDFTYDSLNRITRFSLGGVPNQGFNVDSFGNMSPERSDGSSYFAFDPVTNRISNLPCAGFYTSPPFDGAGNQTCDMDSNGSPVQYSYDAGSHLVAITGSGSNQPFETYIYGADEIRVRKTNFSGAFTEYINFGGEPIAEKNSGATWTDYVYADGKRIARIDSADMAMHLHATSTCGNCRDAVSWLLSGVNNYTVKSGDKISWRQYQSGTVNGGIQDIWFYNFGGLNAPVPDTNGELINSGSSNTWEQRTFDLTPWAGQTIQAFRIGATSFNGTGDGDMWFADMALIGTNGITIPLFYRNPSVQMTTYGDFSGLANGSITVDTSTVPPGTTTNYATTYYMDDHLGTAQMELSAAGWPVWKGTFAPYGQELDNLLTPNHYKFTGKERDAESGLDYFGARYYASTMGRMMSPDWSAESDPVPYADLNNPQSLNLYAYVGNNPLSHTDSDGHDEDDDEDEGEGQATLVAPATTAAAEAIGAGGPIVIAPSVTPLIVGCAILCATEMGNDPAEQRYLKTLGQPRVTPSPTDSQVNSPTMDEHTRRRGSKKKTNDKHTKPRPGRNNTKDRQNPNWRPYRDYVKPKNPTPRPPMPTPLPDPTPPPPPPPKDRHGEPS